MSNSARGCIVWAETVSKGPELRKCRARTQGSPQRGLWSIDRGARAVEYRQGDSAVGCTRRGSHPWSVDRGPQTGGVSTGVQNCEL